MEKITGLWKNKTKAGDVYLSGKWLGLRIIILPDKNREKGSNQPHYTLFLAEKQASKPVGDIEEEPLEDEL